MKVHTLREILYKYPQDAEVEFKFENYGETKFEYRLTPKRGKFYPGMLVIDLEQKDE